MLSFRCADVINEHLNAKIIASLTCIWKECPLNPVPEIPYYHTLLFLLPPATRPRNFLSVCMLLPLPGSTVCHAIKGLLCFRVCFNSLGIWTRLLYFIFWIYFKFLNESQVILMKSENLLFFSEKLIIYIRINFPFQVWVLFNCIFTRWETPNTFSSMKENLLSQMIFKNCWKLRLVEFWNIVIESVQRKWTFSSLCRT